MSQSYSYKWPSRDPRQQQPQQQGATTGQPAPQYGINWGPSAPRPPVKGMPLYHPVSPPSSPPHVPSYRVSPPPGFPAKAQEVPARRLSLPVSTTISRPRVEMTSPPVSTISRPRVEMTSPPVSTISRPRVEMTSPPVSTISRPRVEMTSPPVSTISRPRVEMTSPPPLLVAMARVSQTKRSSLSPRNRCICQRAQCKVLCSICKQASRGRVRLQCPQHPHTIHLMDYDCCPTCKAVNLTEVELRPN
ncbi:merozoite surface protein CMZ-8-like isoform X2 [Asterias rubens]|uniref:merozoite surface protein CMZ-8-like isoform X2 n=1 Tax=Asterias rubens TaxID=7604 RepID=UPI0014552C71|nr:merozoite surface protein CMZ-8-like isoform X2 [Asterias rubens]